MATSTFSIDYLRHLAKLGLLRSVLREELLLELSQQNRLEPTLSDQALHQFRQQHALDNDEAEKKFLEQNLLSQNDLRLLAERPIVISNYIEANFQRKAEARFLQRKDSLDQVVYSLIRVGNQGLARELHLQISEAEADFPKLAPLHSEGPERLTLGIVGPAPLNQGHPQLVHRLKGAAKGELMPPFAIESWWVIVRLEERLEASFDEEAAQRMATELFEEWLKESIDQRTTTLIRQQELNA